ncbi:hypothetical protein BGZ94_006776 [Podila epigama]|nr:hypothetical protein BGZ94_006776 [Podila epigama]
MEQLRAMFPQHNQDLLRQCLAESYGEVSHAIDLILATPMPTANESSSQPVIDLTGKKNNGENHSSSSKANVYDLTQDSSDEDDEDDEDDIPLYLRAVLTTSASSTSSSRPCTNCGNLHSSSSNNNNNNNNNNNYNNNNNNYNNNNNNYNNSRSSSSNSNNNQDGGHAPLPSPTGFDVFHIEQQRLQKQTQERQEQLERERRAIVANFVASAQVLFENISVPYLESLMEEMKPKAKDDNELVELCVEKIFALNGQYPKAKRKRVLTDDYGANGSGSHKRSFLDGDDDDDEDDDEDEDEDGGTGSNFGAASSSGTHNNGSSSTLMKRDYMDCSTKMPGSYDTDCAVQLYQDFPKLTANCIRACLALHNFHYAPAFFYLTAAYNNLDLTDDKNGKTVEKNIKLVEMKSVRKEKPPRDPNTLNPDFRREWQWVKDKLAKELAEIEKAEEEERNLQYYTERGELVECGCCYDDVPPNRTASCDEGHLFCLSCSRRGAEVELGYQRTVLKCMTDGCTSQFSDSEAIRFLPLPVFKGLQKTRQQSEIKMAGLDSLVECPFCSYAAIVENDDDKEFRCMGRKCKKVSCRLCKAPTHIPMSCDEYQKEMEKNNVLSVQHKLEEHMTQALIRECPKCKCRFFKTEGKSKKTTYPDMFKGGNGCNKMTCPQCHTKMCYICKKQIRDYSHFDQTPATEPARKAHLCRLWDNTVERNENDVKMAAQQMIQELKNDEPELVSKVVVDIPK